MISKQERLKGFVKSLYIKPKAAFRKLRIANEFQQNVFLSAAVGYGKTSLINAYFGSQSILYVSAKHIGEDLRQIEKKLEQAALAEKETEAEVPESFGTGPVPSAADTAKRVLVIDDLQYLSMLDADPEEQARILRLLDRTELWVILISRGKIPRWLMNHHMKAPFFIMNENDLSPSFEEISELCERLGLPLTADNIRDMHEIGEHSAHVMLHAVSAFANGARYTESTINEIRIRYFEYLEREVYERWDTSMYSFFMKVSIVDRFTIPLAKMITGRSDVAEIVRRAEEIGNFLKVEYDGDQNTGTVTPVYSLRNSARLAQRQALAKHYSEAQIANLYCNAGIYYEMNGASEAAIQMYREAGAEDRVISLLEENVRRSPEVSNYYQLRHYYLTIPEDTVRTSIMLVAGLSMLHALLLNVEKSEYWYNVLNEAAEEAEGAAKRQAVSILRFLDVVLPQRTIAQMPEAFRRIGEGLAEHKLDIIPVSSTSSLPSVLNGAKDMLAIGIKPEAFQRLTAAVRQIVGNKINGIADLAEAEMLFYGKTDIYRALELQVSGRMAAERENNFELAFVSVMLSIWSSVLDGNLQDAYAHCTSFEEKIRHESLPLIKKNLSALRIYLDLYRGELKEAEAWLKTLNEHVEFITYYRFLYLIKIRVYIALGRLQEALALLKQMLYYAETIGRDLVRIECKLLLAVVEFRLHQPEWEEQLKAALDEAARYHMVRLITREGAAVMPLLKAGGWTARKSSFALAVREELVRMVKQYPKYLKDETAALTLSENAIAILRMQSAGKTVNEIAEELNIQPETVKYHNNHTYKKLGVKGKAAAVLEARRRGIID